MKRTGSNARWNNLTPKQRETLDEWLFEEELGYKAILPRARAELDFKGSLTSLKRYYARRREERLAFDLKELQKNVAGSGKAATDPGALRTASMKLAGGYLFQKVHEAPEKVKEWAPVASLIIQNDYNEMMREIKREEHEIRREAMVFAKEKYQFDMMKRALKALPQLLELAEAKKDPNIKRYEENRYWNELRRAMFGPGTEVHPESAEEEAEMLAAKKERDAQAGIEPEEEEERIIDVQPPTPSSPYYKEFMEYQAKREKEGE